MDLVDYEKARKALLNRAHEVAMDIEFYEDVLSDLRASKCNLEGALKMLTELENCRREMGMIELIRLCNTPCCRYRPSRLLG